MAPWTYALTSVAEVLAYLGEHAQRDAFSLYFTGTSGTNTVTVNDATLALVDADNGATPPFTFANASYDTLTELVAAINVITGWVAELIYHGSANTADMITTGTLDAEAVGNKQTLKIKDVYLIERLIDRASDLIERYCNRKLVSRAYSREIYYGSGATKLLLEQYPVTQVTRLSSGRSNSFSILNTSTDANYCTVEVTSTAMKLIVDGGANEVTGSIDFTLATYTYIDELIAAIHDNGGGWSCTTMATDTGSRDASELLIRPSMFVDPTTQAYIETVDDDLTEYRLLEPTEDRNFGALKRPSIFSPSTEYFVNYVAGYTSIPYALEQACIELVKYKYDLSKRGAGLKSEKIGNVYAYENFNIADLKNGLSPELVAELDLFRRRDF